MLLLILGLLVWSGAHLFKRLAPAARASLGPAGRGMVATAILVSIALMVIGYKLADGAVFWVRTPVLTGINNLMMLLSVYLFAASGMKTAVARRLRHPMLAAVRVWAAAHIVVNGDVPSFVLFGGLLIWSLAEVIVINRAEPDWKAPEPKPMRKEIIAVVASLVVFGVVAGVHTWLGYPAFG